MNTTEQQRLELIKRTEKSTYSVRIFVLAFFVISIVVKYVLDIPLSTYVFLLEIGWLLLSYPSLLVIRKAKTVEQINNLHLAWIICELVLLTMIIHFLGGIGWIGPIFYLFFPIYESFLFARLQRTLMFVGTVLVYLILAFSEYLSLVPYHNPFSHFNPYLNPAFFWTTLITEIGMFTLAFVAVGLFRSELEEKIIKLNKAYNDLEEIKNTLAVRVNAKTYELRRLNETLEEQVKRKTQELKERMEELERFQRITVGRELKMMDLKKEIQRLKEKLKKQAQ